MANPLTEVKGVVEALNPKGFKIQGRDQWLNYSPYGYQGPQGATNPTPAPFVGQYIHAQLKNDKFLHTLTIAGASNPTAMPPPMQQAHAVPPAGNFAVPGVQQAQQLSSDMDALIRTKVETRLSIMKTMAVAQPTLFTLENGDTLVEIIRNLEQFVLEDLISANEPVLDDDDEDITADDLDESI